MIDIRGAVHALTPGLDDGARLEWVEALVPALEYAKATTVNRAAMFLGQAAAESDGFRVLRENLMYTHADLLHSRYPNEFPTAQHAEAYVGHPEFLANRVYAGKLGNGSVRSGDGWRFRGAGIFQLTGRMNFEECMHDLGLGNEIDVDEFPALCTTPRWAAMSAAWFWASHGHLNGLADQWSVKMCTAVINGGLTDLAKRETLCATARRFLLNAGEYPGSLERDVVVAEAGLPSQKTWFPV